MRSLESWSELDAGRHGLNWHGWEDRAVSIKSGGEYTCVLQAQFEMMRRAMEAQRGSMRMDQTVK